MARTGSFGRLPRSAPSLTNTLISIMREQQQQEDQNIMDAWQKGGTVDGQKVTDKVVLAHWNARLADISKDDPLYDTYKNLVTQYDYNIAESKMTAQYAMKASPTSGDDMAMVNFYMKWAKRIPKDTEFYRVLQRDAGQYLRSAKARQTASTQASQEKAYVAQMGAMEKKNELPGQSAVKMLTLLAQQHSLAAESPLGDASNIANSTNIDTLRLAGVDQMMALLQSLTPAQAAENPKVGKPGTAQGAAAPGDAVIYVNEANQPVTRSQVIEQFKAMDPTFTGKFDMNYLQSAIKAQNDGIQKRIDLARKTGHISDAMQLETQQAKISELGRETAAWPVAEEYNNLHTQKQAVLDNTNLLPTAKAAALRAIDSKIGALAGDPRIVTDLRMQDQLRGEAEGRAGTPTLAEDLEGTHSQVDDTTKGDNAMVQGLLKTYDEQTANVQAGTHVMTQGVYQQDQLTGKTVFVAQVGGPSFGAATMDDINNLPGGKQAQLVMVPNGDGGGSTPMMITPQPIVASARNADGSPMDPANVNPAGYFIQYPVNGKMTTLYSIDRKGVTTWTFDPPWDTSKANFHVENGVGKLDLTAAAPYNASKDGTPAAAIDLNKDHAIGNGWYVTGVSAMADGTPIPGKLTFKPQEAALSTDPARQAAGHDIYTDSFSASLAGLRQSPDGQTLLQQWTDNPTFKAVLDQNAHLAAGQTRDPQTGIWTGGDANAYASFMGSAQSELNNAKTGQPLVMDPAMQSQVNKSSTDNGMDGAASALAQAFGHMGAGGNWVTVGMTSVMMPSTAANAAGKDNQMSALSSAADKGGNFPMLPGDTGSEKAMSLKTAGTLTLPGYTPPAPSPMPGATPAPYAPPAPIASPTTPGAVPQMSAVPTAAPTAATTIGGSAAGGSYSKNRAL